MSLNNEKAYYTQRSKRAERAHHIIAIYDFIQNCFFESQNKIFILIFCRRPPGKIPQNRKTLKQNNNQ